MELFGENKKKHHQSGTAREKLYETSGSYFTAVFVSWIEFIFHANR